MYTDTEERRIFRPGTPVTFVICKDIRNRNDPSNIIYHTEQFSNRFDERILDREVPYSFEPQVLTNLLANGITTKYPANAVPITRGPVLSPLKIGINQKIY